MRQLYCVRRTSTVLIELEDVSQQEASHTAAEFWIDSTQSLKSSGLGSVPLNSIRYLVEFSSAGTGLEHFVQSGSDSPFGGGVRCPEVLETSTSESLAGGE